MDPRLARRDRHRRRSCRRSCSATSSLIEWLLGCCPSRCADPAPAVALARAGARRSSFVFLVYPTIVTVVRSLQDKSRQTFVGLANYRTSSTPRHARVRSATTSIWLVLLTALAVGLGLIIAVLLDRVRYEPAAKSLIFLPLAISFVGAGVIWKFMYDYRPGRTRPRRAR